MAVIDGQAPQGALEARTYWENVGFHSRMGNYITAIEKNALLRAHAMFPRPGVALEVGCDGGRWSVFLNDLGWQMKCTDVNAESLRVCQDRVPSAECVLVDPGQTALPFADRSVQMLLCYEVMDVIESPWFLSEARRVLADAGVLVCTFWNSRSLRGLVYRVAPLIIPHKEFHGYYGGVPYSEFRRHVVGSGFRVSHEEGLCWVPFSRSSNSPIIPLCGRMERVMGLHKLPSLSPWIVLIASRD